MNKKLNKSEQTIKEMLLIGQLVYEKKLISKGEYQLYAKQVYDKNLSQKSDDSPQKNVLK